MLQHGLIRIQKSIHTVLRTALFIPVQIPTRYTLRYAFRPADVRKAMYRCQRLKIISFACERVTRWSGEEWMM